MSDLKKYIDIIGEKSAYIAIEVKIPVNAMRAAKLIEKNPENFCKLCEMFETITNARVKSAGKKSVESIIFDDIFLVLTLCFTLGFGIYGCKQNPPDQEIRDWFSKSIECYNSFITFFNQYGKKQAEIIKTNSSVLCCGTSFNKNYVPTLEYYERVDRSLKKFEQEYTELYRKILVVIGMFADNLGVNHDNIVYSSAAEIREKIAKQLKSEINVLIRGRAYTDVELCDRINNININ